MLITATANVPTYIEKQSSTQDIFKRKLVLTLCMMEQEPYMTEVG